ncbi:MAG: tetratricopeptide repeat protein [Acidobacteriota bacterium]
MSRSTFALVGDRLRWLEGSSGDERVLGETEQEDLRAFAVRYAEVVKSLSSREKLLELGKDLYSWLNGAGRWLDRAKGSGVTPPWFVEFRTAPEPDSLGRALLDAPWELLAEGDQFLAEIPTRNLCPLRRLGQPEEPGEVKVSRPRMVFMTAAPEGATPLSVEAEENLILDATSDLGLDLLVEDSGNVKQLGKLLSRQPESVEIVHLSCHGQGNPPVLLTEDDFGGEQFTGIAELDQALRLRKPPLVTLSACETAAADSALGSLAAGLLPLGYPAVLGWGAKVLDSEATLFASVLYREISSGARVEEAVARARQALLQMPQVTSRDWHQARLFLGLQGGGQLVQHAAPVPAPDQRQAVEKAMLDARLGKTQVASPEAFVGRRWQLQRTLAAFREGRIGVLLHGMGRLGKSSLALRVMQRMQQGHYRPVVFYGAFDSVALINAIADQLVDKEKRKAARKLAEDARFQAPSLEAFVDELVDLLPSANENQPLLFVLDDFEQLLQDDCLAPRPLQSIYIDTVTALLRALERSDSASRVLITSRFTFTLPFAGRDLADLVQSIQLAQMSSAERRRQLRTRLRLGNASLRSDLERSITELGSGNPGLQDLLTNLALESRDSALVTFQAMKRYLDGKESGTQDMTPEVAHQLKNLAIQGLIKVLDEKEKELLRLSTLFETPIPVDLLDDLAEELALSKGGEARQRLQGLGLWESVPWRNSSAAQINALARPHAGTVEAGDEEAIAKQLVEPLHAAWSNEAGKTQQYDHDIQLARLALAAQNVGVAAHVATDALSGLVGQERHLEAEALGKKLLGLLRDSSQPAPKGFLVRLAEICVRVGDTQAARELFSQARDLLDAQSEGESPVDLLHRARVQISYARLLRNDGRIEEALTDFRSARDLLSYSGHRREHAVTLGDIARIHAERGDIDKALQLHNEQLQICKEIGEVKGQAVTLGDIARIHAGRGDIDKALQLHNQQIQDFDDLGDRRERAVTLGYIARIHAGRGDIDKALQLHNQELHVYDDLGDRRSRAVTLGDIARIHAGRGNIDKALQLHKQQLQDFEELGDRRSRAVTLGDIARIHAGRGDIDKALQLHNQELHVYDDLGDRRSRAVTLGDIARIHSGRGDIEQALQLHNEKLQIVEDLGDPDGIANTLWSIARIELRQDEHQAAFDHFAKSYQLNLQLGRLDGIAFVGLDLGQMLCAGGNLEEGRTILQRSLEGFRKLGLQQEANRVEQILASLPSPTD